MKFKVIIEEGEDGRYVVEVPALPGFISQLIGFPLKDHKIL